MLLRRITKHVQNQDWFAVFIDFLIVVVGILIAFQITEWNNSLSDRARETHYLENLTGDIKEELVVIEEVRHALLVRISVIEKILADSLGEQLPRTMEISASAKAVTTEAEFPIPEPLSLDGFDSENFLSFAIFTRIFNGENSTFARLLTTGDLGIIRNDVLAYSIADYYENIETLKTVERGTTRQERDYAAAAAKRNGLNPMGRNDYNLVLAAIENDPEFAASLRSLRNISALNFSLIINADREARIILSSLEKELN